MKTFARKLFSKYVAHRAGKSEYVSIGKAERAPINIVFLGTCQFDMLLKELRDSRHKVRHLLMGSRSYSEVPAAKDGDDCVVVGLVLRQIISEASGAAVPASDMFFARLSSAEEADAMLARSRTVIARLVDRIYDQHKGRPVFFMSFFEPSFNYLGDLLDPFAPTSAQQVVRNLNMILSECIRAHPDCYYFEVNDILNQVGRALLQDDIVLHGSHGSFINDWNFKLDNRRLSSPQMLMSAVEFQTAMHRFASFFIEKLASLYAITKQAEPIKLIICDLDDTLWRGVAAEEDDFSDDDRIEGWPLGLIEALLAFKARGGILALCSKNELEGTKARFDRIFRGAITFDDFAVAKVNWTPKPQNIAEILKETNILAKNSLFIDDNPRELAEVSAGHPELRCLGTDHYNWRKTVLKAPETQVTAITAESMRRTELVRASAERRAATDDAGRSTEDREAWLRDLDLRQSVQRVADAKSKSYDRAFELINKTNQFNTNGKRWSQGEFDKFLGSGGICLVSDLQDRTVDNGIISVCLLKDDEIVQMVLSCRVFGLGAEQVVCAHAVDLILKDHEKAVGRIVDTGRNATCHGFYGAAGFAEVEGRFEIDRRIDLPGHIKLAGAMARAMPG
jgi:FkbH-like protein